MNVILKISDGGSTAMQTKAKSGWIGGTGLDPLWKSSPPRAPCDANKISLSCFYPDIFWEWKYLNCFLAQYINFIRSAFVQVGEFAAGFSKLLRFCPGDTNMWKLCNKKHALNINPACLAWPFYFENWKFQRKLVKGQIKKSFISPDDTLKQKQ